MSLAFVNALNLTAVTPVPDLAVYGWPFGGPGWEAYSPGGEVQMFRTQREAHAWRLDEVRAYLGMGLSAVCQCEHASHFNGDAHDYQEAQAGRAVSVYVGRVCDLCADGAHGYLIGVSS